MSLIQKRFQYATYGLFVLVAAFILMTFEQHGISNDEPVQHEYGRLLLRFYQSGFEDQAAFHYKNLYLYGGFFDLLAATFEKIVPLWLWDFRHLLSALFGLAGLVAVYKISCLLESPRTGFIAVVLLVLTASWSGAMFTHTKDIPFATFMAWALYYTILASKSLPTIPLRVSLKLGVSIGFALGMRIGGCFAVIYLLLLLTYASFLPQLNRQSIVKFWVNVVASLIPAALVAFYLMAIFWPWGVMSPSHPFEAIKAFSHFSFDMKTLDDGQVFSIGAVPRTYLLSYLLVKLPEVFLLGLLSFILMGVLNFKRILHQLGSQQALGIVAVLIALIFPLSFVIITQPALYNGVRHFTFILPPLAVLGALGIHYVFQALYRFLALKVMYLLVCVALCVSTFVELGQLHPYEYTYYNAFAGQLLDAETKWEGDYWSSSLREAANALKQTPLEVREKPYLVAVCAENLQGEAYLDERFQITKDWIAADFFMSSTSMHCDRVLQGQEIGRVERLGSLLAIVKDRRALVGEARIPKDPNQ
jgi:hypothetical protein